jgi:hypothetical protein
MSRYPLWAAQPDYFRVVRQRCVSLYTLYGGAKEQRRNYIRVPPGSVGLVTYEVTEGEDGSAYYLVKFRVGARSVHVRCAPAMVRLEPASTGGASPATGGGEP